MLYGKSELTGVERFFDESDIIVTKTDISGKITYGNRAFFQISGLEEGKSLHQQHNIVRHPDMPRCVFDLMWDTIKAGGEIFAYVVNRAQNGDHYWVFAHVTASLGPNGEVLGYHSNRRVPDRQVIDEHIKPLYKELIRIEAGAESPKKAITAGRQYIDDMLSQKKTNFNAAMFALG